MHPRLVTVLKPGICPRVEKALPETAMNSGNSPMMERSPLEMVRYREDCSSPPNARALVQIDDAMTSGGIPNPPKEYPRSVTVSNLGNCSMMGLLQQETVRTSGDCLSSRMEGSAGVPELGKLPEYTELSPERPDLLLPAPEVMISFTDMDSPSNIPIPAPKKGKGKNKSDKKRKKKGKKGGSPNHK